MKVRKACRFRRSIKLESILHKDLFYTYADMPKKMDNGARPLILRCTLSWSAQHVQSHFCRTVFGSNRNKIEDIHGSFFWFLKSSEDCCNYSPSGCQISRGLFSDQTGFCKFFLGSKILHPTKNRAPTILVKRFSGEKQNLSSVSLIQIEGQEEQQDKQQREQQEEQQEERRSRK